MAQQRVHGSPVRRWPPWPIRRTAAPGRGLVDELQRSERVTVWTLCVMLVLSLLSSGYLLLVSHPRVATLTQLTAQSRVGYAAMLDQQAALNGWLATGDEFFLASYQSYRREWDAVSRQLVDAQEKSPAMARGTLDTLLTQQVWASWAHEAAGKDIDDARRTGTLDEFLVDGTELFDPYKVAQADLTDAMAAERDHALALQRTALVGMLVVTLLLLGSAAAFAQRRRRRLRRTVTKPLRRLLGTIGDLRSGDLTVRSARTDVAELDSIGSALGALATDLQRAGDEASAREARLARMAARFETVARVAREASVSLSARYVSETVASAASDLLGTETTLWVRNDDGQFLATRHSGDAHGVVPASTLVAPALVATVAADARPVGDGTSRAYPLMLAGMVIGVLEAAISQPDDDVEHVLDALLSTAAAALEAARLHSSVRELAEVDALTQLPNRRRLETDLAAEWERGRRYARPLSFVMLDLDHFKELNDQYGHLAGDVMLHASAAAVAGILRSSDTAYRYGGEEIAVLLRETGPGDAAAVGERLRAAVAATTVVGTPATVTASVGVASATIAMLDYPELMAIADAALYEAKRSGRNRVVVARDAPLVPID
jgi:diguanylate cyclase (GGDEF)-like protein